MGARCRPARPAGITVKDLQTSRMSHTLFSILSDVQQFYEYNYRENSMHMNEEQ
jgi:serine/threonine-protein phosphatase 2A regulatory subunit B''